MLLSDAPSARLADRSIADWPQAASGSPNRALRQLVETSGLPQAVAMTIFNRQLGAHGCSETEWRGFLADPDSPRYREMTAEQLSHAVVQFARIGVYREQN